LVRYGDEVVVGGIPLTEQSGSGGKKCNDASRCEDDVRDIPS
jgi:hypothetical protein